MLHLLVASSRRLVGLKAEAEHAQSVVDVHLGDAERLALANVVDKELGRVEYSVIEERTLNDSLIRLLNELVDQVVSLIDLGELHVLLKAGEELLVVLGSSFSALFNKAKRLSR